MMEPEIPFPVTCPHCGEESLAEFRVSVLADALSGGAIRLYAKCHLVSWDASDVELEQIRQHLETTLGSATQSGWAVAHPRSRCPSTVSISRQAATLAV